VTARRVLVVDDSAVIRELAQVALGMIGGLEVTTAESGDEALERAATAAPDVILLDVEMPGLDGPETLALLREEPATREIPVIYVTAHDAPDEHDDLGGLGVAGVIAKPFEVARLAEQVAGLAGWDG